MQNRLIVIMIVLLITLFGCSKTISTFGSKHVTKEMDEAISDYIIQYYKEVYGSTTEKQFEVHNIYGTEEKDGVVTVYFHSLYEEFNLDTKTEAQAGHSLPALVRLEKDGSTYSVIEYKEPKDGSENAPSIKKMFPDAYEKRAINSANDIEALQTQMDKKVEQWLAERNK